MTAWRASELLLTGTAYLLGSRQSRRGERRAQWNGIDSSDPGGEVTGIAPRDRDRGGEARTLPSCSEPIYPL